ncbi:hypothetical protein RJT34_32098 [Clitoria ternatea]|uniref:Uncharacterized protein n=1 Tax=Clitoria ternatea TaxID=43366 RepID=A0AAN9I474_CLITE
MIAYNINIFYAKLCMHKKLLHEYFDVYIFYELIHIRYLISVVRHINGTWLCGALIAVLIAFLPSSKTLILNGCEPPWPLMFVVIGSFWGEQLYAHKLLRLVIKIMTKPTSLHYVHIVPSLFLALPSQFLLLHQLGDVQPNIEVSW